MAEDGYHGAHGWLVGRLGRRGGEAVYAFFACVLALAVSGLAAYAFRQPLLFPSLGPTALLFFEQPMSPGSSPRNTLIGHLVAVLAGALCLYLLGLYDDPSILREGVTLARVGAAALSLALVGAAPATFVYSYLGEQAPQYVNVLLAVFGVVIAAGVVTALVRRRRGAKEDGTSK